MSASSSTRTAVIRPSASAAELDVLDLAPALDGRLGVLGALLHPADRAAQPLRQHDGEDLLGVDVQLGAEAAADGRRHDAQLGLGGARRDGEHDLQDVGDLRGRVDGELAAEGLRHDHEAAGLHGGRDEALLHVGPLDPVGGARKGALDAAASGSRDHV